MLADLDAFGRVIDGVQARRDLAHHQAALTRTQLPSATESVEAMIDRLNAAQDALMRLTAREAALLAKR